MRRTHEAREQVLKHRGRFDEVQPRNPDPKAPSPLKVREVWVGDRRYVVCRNPLCQCDLRHLTSNI
jgi:hypothetical protein